jgi:hypothetical protein
MDIWSLIESKEFELASKKADLEFQKTGSLFPLRNKVYALLQLRQYDSVELVSNLLIVRSNGSTSVDFISLGIAYWFQHKRQQALCAWTSGLRANYQDAGGGVIINMILYFGAVKCQNEVIAKKAIANLTKLIANSKTLQWPIPLALFLLGTLETQKLVAIASSEPLLKERHLCQAYFVISIAHLEKG